MANIRENKKNGKTISFRFIACLERNAQGKQVRRYTTWIPPEGLTPSRARKVEGGKGPGPGLHAPAREAAR